MLFYSKAETFASGAISILESLHADFVCFGSENGNIDSFTRTADLLEAHESELSALIQQEMKKETVIQNQLPMLSYSFSRRLLLIYLSQIMCLE